MPDLSWLASLVPDRGEADPAQLLLTFGRELRDHGVPVGTGSIIAFCEAASLCAPEDLYWVGRATLISDRQYIKTYDMVFRGVFSSAGKSYKTVAPQIIERAVNAYEETENTQTNGRELGAQSMQASQLEILRTRSFDTLTEQELAELAKLVRQVDVAVPLRRTRRRRPGGRGRVDVKRTARRILRTSGSDNSLVLSQKRRKERRLIFILDVSGSMTAHARGMLTFVHGALRTHPRWEVFCFGTRLTRVTRLLAATNTDDALARAAECVTDWDGGTRIGDSLKAFLDIYGHAGMARGSVVVICSDGLETGDVEKLGIQMRRLNRLAYRTVWVNPLKVSPGYAPTAGGMERSLPFVDIFESGHTLASLEQLADQLAKL